jgi:hypothetical protein
MNVFDVEMDASFFDLEWLWIGGLRTFLVSG